METVDYVIIGAGIAGMTLQYVLRDRQVALIDPAPGKYKIGESIVPQHFIEPEMRPFFDVVQSLPSATPKDATLFVADDSVACFPPFSEAKYTIHVARQDLDAATAKYFGSEIIRERVNAVDLETKTVTTDKRTFRARGLIIDCSGPARIIGRALGLVREVWPVWASWAYHDVTGHHDERLEAIVRSGEKAFFRFNDTERRLEDNAPYEHFRPIHCTTLTRVRDGMWTWQIPLYGAKMLSVGVVSRFGPISESEYRDIVKAGIAPQFDTQIRPFDRSGPFNSFHVRNRFAWAADQFAGDSWALVGDAAFFGDPVYSVGTGLATNHAIQLGRILHDHEWTPAVAGAFNRATAHLFERTKRAYDHWYFGHVVADKNVALDIQTNFLNGRAFQVQTAEAYSTMWQVAHPQDAANPMSPKRGEGEDVTEHVASVVSGGGELVGWHLDAARAFQTRIEIDWTRPDTDPVTLEVQRLSPGQAYYCKRGELGLSYRPPRNETGKLDAQGLALVDAFADVVAELEPRLRELMDGTLPS